MRCHVLVELVGANGHSRIKVAVLVDRGHIPVFGLRALDALKVCDEITVFSCANTRMVRKPLRHFAYYALNLFTVRNPLTRMVSITSGRKRVAEQIDFNSDYEGAWQTLPREIISKLAGFDVIIKLGMSLLRVPPQETLPAPILSWHHGDPDRYRGRPAGFWEMVEGAPVLGQIIQIISNKLDAGGVVAFAETRVRPYSYRATLLDAYGHSHLLLNQAVRNAIDGNRLPKVSGGRNYRLPSNLTVFLFLIRMMIAYLRRLIYGAFVEKNWQVSIARLNASTAEAVAEGRDFPPFETWRTLQTPPGYLFLADPFFSEHPKGILVEALNRRTSLGEIMLVQEHGAQKLSSVKLHMSYPSTLRLEDGQLVIPEIAQSGAQRCFRIREGRLEDAGELEVEGAGGIVDPTLIEHQGRFYLFGNNSDQGSGVLYLWSSTNLSEPFSLHPSSPIRISPRGARMAGALLHTDDRIIRFGQNFLGDYGDGVFAFEVLALDDSNYEERLLGTIEFHDRQGPHTINFDEDQIVFDWYVRRVSPLAGVRRVIARLAERRSRSKVGASLAAAS